MSFMTEYGASHLFVRAFHLVPVIVLRLFTVSVSYGSVIMSLPFLSLMEVSPIGWSGSCSRMSSWLISIFHDFAKSMAVLRWLVRVLWRVVLVWFLFRLVLVCGRVWVCCRCLPI